MEKSVRLRNFVITLIFISCFLILFKPVLVQQIIIRGDGYLGFGMNHDAIRQYKKALFLDSKNIDAKNWLAYAYKRSGQIENAVETYKDSLRLSPNNLIACYELGMIYATKGDFRQAKPYFLKASLISKEDIPVSNEDYDFYHGGSLKMLDTCYKRLGENGKDLDL